jgi:hypothetical protein
MIMNFPKYFLLRRLGNVRGFNCYHVRDYDNLFDNQKKELLTQGQKKSLEIIESAADVPFDA